MERNSFVRGALLLAGAAMFSKLLGSVYTIVLQNIIGDHGMGLFQMAYPVYATLLAIATAGFPVAISKLVSEALALGDAQGAARVLRVSLSLLSICGVIAFVVLFVGAHRFAMLAGDAAATASIQAIAPALLIVPVMSVLRGYFQGYQWMEPTAKSQVIEQSMRVATIIGLSVWLTAKGFSTAISAAGAAFGAVTGAIAGLLSVLYDWRRRGTTLPQQTRQAAGYLQMTKRLLYYAFPISLGALVVPLMNNVDVITVVNLLKHAGESQAQATTEFGLLSGRAVKLMMLPTTLAAGIGIAAMPAVSEAFTLGYRSLMRNRVDLAIRMTMLMALPAAVGLMVLARPINVTLFENANGTDAIQILAIAIVFASVQTTLAALLQGAGKVYLPVLHLALGCALKFILNLWWVPHAGIAGAAWATTVSYALAALLNLIALFRSLGESMNFAEWFLKPAVASFIMYAVLFAASRQWPTWFLANARVQSGLASIGAIALGAVVYTLALLASGSLSRDELAGIPRFGPKLVLWCARLGLLKS